MTKKHVKKDIPAVGASSMKMMFVASHGLQTPLSAIRWGSRRLQKADTGTLTPEQRHLIEGISDNARMLSRMLDAMLILAKVEDGGYAASSQQIHLADFLRSFLDKFELPNNQQAEIRCPDDLEMNVDRGILETVVQSLLIAMSSSMKGSKAMVLTASRTGDAVRIDIRCPLELSLLSPVRAGADENQVNQLVGGPTGLMLSIAHSLAQSIGGSVQLAETEKDNYVLSLSLQA